MFTTRERKIIRDVIARKGRTALVSLAIFIGVAGTIALFSMRTILVRQLEEDIQEEKLAMVQVYIGVETGTQLDNAAYLKTLSKFTDLTQVQAGVEATPIYFKTQKDDESFEDGGIHASVILGDDQQSLKTVYDDAPIEPVRLIEGRLPQDRKNEVAIEMRMAEKYGLSVGDTLYVRILSPSRDQAQNGATGTTEAWIITGTVFDPYVFAPDGAVYTDLPNAVYITAVDGFGTIWARFTDYPTAEEFFTDFQNFIANNTPYTVGFAEKEDPAQSSLIEGARLLGNVMSFLALVALVVSGFLVINVITAIVTEQKRQIGVMKSIGATRGDNFVIYSGIAFMYGLLGVIPGVLVGIPGGNAAANALAPEVNTVLSGFNTSPAAIALGIFVGLAIPVLSSFIPVFNGTRVQILDAMTDLGIDAKYGTGPLARLIKLLPVPITVRQGFSNVSLKKTRLAFTVITLAIAVGAFMGITAIFETMTTGINQYIDSFNIQLGIIPAQPGDPEQFRNIMLENFPDDISSIEPGFNLQVEFEGYTPEFSAGGPPGIFAFGYDVYSETPAFKFEIDEGQPITEETETTGIIFSTTLANNMGKDVGDTVILKVPGASREFQIVGLSEFPVEQCWLHWKTLAEFANYTFDEITSDSPIPADVLPPEAENFIKYLTVATIDGYEGTPLPMLPGTTLVAGFTPTLEQYLMFEDGEFFKPNEPGVIITSVMAEQGGFTVGDRVTLHQVRVEGTEVTEGDASEYPIVGVFNMPPLFANDMIPPDFVAMYWGDAAKFDNATIESQPRPQAWFIITSQENPSADEVGDMIDTMNDRLIELGIPAFGFNFVELTELISDGFATIQNVLSAVAGLIALVGALGLLTTLSISVFERQKEIGVMRSIGAGSITVATQFLTEGLLVGIIAWIVGLPLMILLQALLLKVTQFEDTFPLQFSPSAAIVGLIGMIIITTIASLWPSLGAARKTVSDILRYQ